MMILERKAVAPMPWIFNKIFTARAETIAFLSEIH